MPWLRPPASEIGSAGRDGHLSPRRAEQALVHGEVGVLLPVPGHPFGDQPPPGPAQLRPPHRVAEQLVDQPAKPATSPGGA